MTNKKPFYFTPVKSDRYKTLAKAQQAIPDDYEIKEDERGFYGVLKAPCEPVDVICPLCGGRHYETTDQYDPDKHAHPGMIRLKEKYANYGWEPAPPDPSAGSGSIECRQCGGLVAPEGRFKLE